jgi:hypothetical protein
MTESQANRALERAFKQLSRNNKNGIITFEEIQGAAPGISEEVILGFMESKMGAHASFISGRRGHSTRIVMGPALEAWRHSEQLRAEWRKKNGKTPTGAQKNGRGRGRPRGSQAMTVHAPVVSSVTRGPGRPKGSKNTTKIETRPVRARIEQGEGDTLANLNLRITVGDNETVLPLKVDLVPAAA